MKYFIAILLAISGAVLSTPIPEPPGIPSELSARNKLAVLMVSPHTNTKTYNRRLFPHWSTVLGTCNTRETVLKRDGINVMTNEACAATSGTWYSPYDGATWTAASDIDIDHMVPLYNAWVSGAANWTTPERRAFANDLVRPQLWAITDNVNQAKGGSSPDMWKPPLEGFYCEYAKSWIEVKWHWKLSVTVVEKSALEDMLSFCQSGF